MTIDHALPQQDTPTQTPTPAPTPKAKSFERTRMQNFMHRLWPNLIMVVVVIVGVWIASLFFDDFIFPGPAVIGSAFVEVVTNDWQQILLTMGRFIVALSCAVLVGWAIGLFMGAFRSTVGRFGYPFVRVIQAIPSLSWILLVVLWFSNIELRIGWVTFVLAFPFFVIAVYEGLRDMDRDMLEAIEQFRPTRMQVLRKMLVPQSFVNLLLVLRSTSAMTLKIMIFAELIGANDGIGQRLSLAQTQFRIDLVLAWTLVLIIVNFLMHLVIDQLEHRLLSWRKEAVVR